MSQETEQKIAIEDDILWLTMSKYELFMSKGSLGRDALILFMHLLYTARKQGTNQIWANNSYLMKGLMWGKERLQKSKQFLISVNMLEVKQGKDDKGCFDKQYLCLFPAGKNTAGIETGRRSEPAAGNSPQMLNYKDKCLTKKNNIDPFIPPSLNDVRIYKEQENLNFDPAKFHDYYSRNEWKDKDGKPVKNWKNKARLVWHKPEEQKEDKPKKKFIDYA